MLDKANTEQCTLQFTFEAMLRQAQEHHQLHFSCMALLSFEPAREDWTHHAASLSEHHVLTQNTAPLPEVRRKCYATRHAT